MTTLDDAITWFDTNISSSSVLVFFTFVWLFSIPNDSYRRWFEGFRRHYNRKAAPWIGTQSVSQWAIFSSSPATVVRTTK